MFILAKTVKGEEFMLNRSGAVEIPKGWDGETVAQVIEWLNRYFMLGENITYSKHEIDKYDDVWPEFKAFKYGGSVKIKRI